MSTEENKAIVRRAFEELWSKANISVLDELFDANFAWHDTISSHRTRNIEDYKGAISTVNDAFGLHFTVEDIIAEGDKVVTRWTACGTYKGGWADISPQSAPLKDEMKIEGVTISRIVGGKIIEEWWFRELFIAHLSPDSKLANKSLLTHLESHS